MRFMIADYAIVKKIPRRISKDFTYETEMAASIVEKWNY